jgi:hypothetical protein
MLPFGSFTVRNAGFAIAAVLEAPCAATWEMPGKDKPKATHPALN